MEATSGTNDIFFFILLLDRAYAEYKIKALKHVLGGVFLEDDYFY